MSESYPNSRRFTRSSVRVQSSGWRIFQGFPCVPRLNRSQLDESEKVREDVRNLILFEWARELLLENKE